MFRIDMLSVFLLLGIVQGLILSFVLVFSRNEGPRPYYLAAFIGVLAYDLFGMLCWSTGLNITWADLLDSLFPYTALFTLGPSFYLYIRTTLQTEKLATRSVVKAYLPPLIDMLARFGIIAYAILSHQNAYGIDRLYHLAAVPLLPIAFCLYLLSSIKYFRHHHSADNHRIKPLLWIMSGVTLLWSITVFSAMLFKLETILHLVPLETIMIMPIY